MWWYHTCFQCFCAQLLLIKHQFMFEIWTQCLMVWGKSKLGLLELWKCGQMCKKVSRRERNTVKGCLVSGNTASCAHFSTHFPFPNQFPTHATTDGHPVVCMSPFITCRTEGRTAWEEAPSAAGNTRPGEWLHIPTPGLHTPTHWLVQSCDAALTHVMKESWLSHPKICGGRRWWIFVY